MHPRGLNWLSNTWKKIATRRESERFIIYGKRVSFQIWNQSVSLCLLKSVCAVTLALILHLFKINKIKAGIKKHTMILPRIKWHVTCVSAFFCVLLFCRFLLLSSLLAFLATFRSFLIEQELADCSKLRWLHCLLRMFSTQL